MRILPFRMKNSSLRTGRMVSAATPRTVRVVAWRRRVSLNKAWGRGSVSRVSRLRAVAKGSEGLVAWEFIAERMLLRLDEACTWIMYHIDAGRGFVSNANSISNIPAPASNAVYPYFLYTSLLVHI